MRPLIETIKSDKVIDENFEAVKNTLCGNVSYDNMSVRILEGTTGPSDTQNQVIHSGNSRPVGWFPLVGDVYVQEISDRFLDIRSTKAEVNYKILILFGPALTDSALKAIGGPNYEDTTTTVTNIADQEISYIEETVIQFKPLATRVYSLPNPCAAASPANTTYEQVITDGDYFYLLIYSTTLAIKQQLWRINRLTGVVDSLDFSGVLAGSSLFILKGFGSSIFLTANCGANPCQAWEVDIVTFAVVNTYNNVNASNRNPVAIYVDTSYIYVSCITATKRQVELSRVNRTTAAVNIITIGPSDAFAAHNYYKGSIVATPAAAGLDGALYVMMDNNFKACGEVARVKVWDSATSVPAFTLTDTLTTTYAFSFRAGCYYSGYVYVPVIYSGAHQTLGGLTSYCSGVAQIDIVAPYAVTFIPVNVPVGTHGNQFIMNIVEQDAYLYMLSYNPSAPVCTYMYRLDTITGSVVNALISLPITGVGANNGIDNLYCKNPDNKLYVIRNTNSTDYSNFEFATVDFSDYDI